jgi:hypothetical protein
MIKVFFPKITRPINILHATYVLRHTTFYSSTWNGDVAMPAILWAPQTSYPAQNNYSQWYASDFDLIPFSITKT